MSSKTNEVEFVLATAKVGRIKWTGRRIDDQIQVTWNKEGRVCRQDLTRTVTNVYASGGVLKCINAINIFMYAIIQELVYCGGYSRTLCFVYIHGRKNWCY